MSKLGYQLSYLAPIQAEMGNDVKIISSNRLWIATKKFKGNEMYSTIYKSRIISQGIYIENGIKTYRLTSLEYKTYNKLIGLEELLKRLKPDVVFLHHFFLNPNLITLIKMKKKLKYKLFVDSHVADYNTNLYDHPFKIIYMNYLKCFLKGKILESIDGYFPVGKSEYNVMVREFPEIKERTEIISLGINRRVFRYDEYERNILRAKLGLLNDDVLILSSGKIQPYKHLETLLKAFSELTRGMLNKKILLALVGSGEKNYIQELKNLTISLGIADKVIFSGWVPNNELYKWFSAADLGVWISGPTISLREATGCDLPLLIPDYWNNGESSEEFVDEENGWRFKLNDYNDLLNKMELLVSNNNKLIEAGKNAVKKAEQLDWRKIALKYQVWYEK
ncbi:glycosyltransferase family 4 protein [Patescibacteria group bacterium]|nr:glycosyltransferase family 4 protein [Patescibacteria group bacterium]